jgi:hypothetical protein
MKLTVRTFKCLIQLKELYQYIADKNRNRDVFCIFLGQENGNVRIRTPRIVIL